MGTSSGRRGCGVLETVGPGAITKYRALQKKSWQVESFKITIKKKKVINFFNHDDHDNNKTKFNYEES